MLSFNTGHPQPGIPMRDAWVSHWTTHANQSAPLYSYLIDRGVVIRVLCTNECPCFDTPYNRTQPFVEYVPTQVYINVIPQRPRASSQHSLNHRHQFSTPILNTNILAPTELQPKYDSSHVWPEEAVKGFQVPVHALSFSLRLKSQQCCSRGQHQCTVQFWLAVWAIFGTTRAPTSNTATPTEPPRPQSSFLPQVGIFLITTSVPPTWGSFSQRTGGICSGIPRREYGFPPFFCMDTDIANSQEKAWG